MDLSRRSIVIAALLLLTAFIAESQSTAVSNTSVGARQLSSAVRQELVPTGRLRVGINIGNALLAKKDAAGTTSGISLDLAKELARRLNVVIDLVSYESAGQMADAANKGGWDIAFLGTDPARANEILFSAPYLEIESTYLVPAGSPLR